jgi:diguanylate cyclase (GGDEF)-like protein/PAS domain S-box-containing protein
MFGTNNSVIKRRNSAYLVTVVLICEAYYALWGHTWKVTVEMLTSAEWVASVLSLCVGALALVRYYSQKEINFLFIGTGFIVNGLLHGDHAVVMSTYFIDAFSPFNLNSIAWSWYGSRLFLPVLLWLSWVFWKRQQKLGKGGGISDFTVYLMVGFTTIVLFVLFDVVPFPVKFNHDNVYTYSREILPAIFYSLALIGYYRKNKWKSDPFEHWLILAMIAGLMGEVMLLPFSGQDYDMMFSSAYLLKAISYLFAFVGLLFNMQRLFSESLIHQELVFKNSLLTTQQETSQDAILVVDEQHTIVSYNRRFIELWPIPEELVSKGDDRQVMSYLGNKVANPKEYLDRVKYLYGHRSETSIEEIPLKDGRIVDRYTAPVNSEDGKYYGRVWYLRDITEKKRNDQRIRESEEKFRGLIEQSLVGIAMVQNEKFSYVNRKFAEIFGYDVRQIMDMSPFDTAVNEDKSIISQVMRDRLESEGEGDEFTFRGQHKFGAVVNIEGRCARMNFGGQYALMIIILDVTERLRAESEIQILQARLREQAIRDPLTGLFNRRYLDEVIMSEIARAERGQYTLSLVMCDLDHFKVVNDEFGHLAGDEVLRAFSRLLKQYSRGGDIICRYGGEEFLLVLPGMAREGAVDRAEQLRLAFAAALMSYNAKIIRATASFGIATFPEDGKDIEELIASADKALYMAKEAGRNNVKNSAA